MFYLILMFDKTVDSPSLVELLFHNNFIKILFIGDLHGLRAIGVGIKYGVYLLCVQLISKRDLQSKYVLRYEQVKTPYGIRASQIVRSSYGLLE